MKHTETIGKCSNDDGISATQLAKDFLEKTDAQLVSFRSIKMRGKPTQAQILAMKRY